MLRRWAGDPPNRAPRLSDVGRFYKDAWTAGVWDACGEVREGEAVFVTRMGDSAVRKELKRLWGVGVEVRGYEVRIDSVEVVKGIMLWSAKDVGRLVRWMGERKGGG